MTAGPHHRDRSGLAVGLLVFFIIKLAAISVGLGSKEGPRLGDDAYVYLFYGELADRNPLTLPGPASLADMAPKAFLAELDEQSRFAAHRVLMRTTQTSRLFSLWPISVVPTDRLTYYEAFWLYELGVLAVMTMGLGILVASLRLERLWLSLPLLALATFPGQGIHFLIPSTLALGFGMGIWGLILARRGHPFLLFAFGIGALLSHAIGLAHIAIGMGLIGVTWLTGSRDIRRAGLEVLALAASVGGFVLFLNLFAINFGLGYDFTRIGMQPFAENLAGYGKAFGRFAERDVIAAVLSLVGIVILVRRKTRWTFGILPDDPVKLLAMGLLAMVVISNFYIINGYPAEVPFRFITVILMLGILTVAHGWAWPRAGWGRTAVMSFCLLAAGLTALDHALRNRDSRWPELDRQVLADRIASVRPESPILYLDADYLLMAGLLAGGMERSAYVPALLGLNPTTGQSRLDQSPPAAAVGLMPKGLRTEAYLGWSPLRMARYGFDLRSSGSVTLKTDSALSGLTLVWDGANPAHVTNLADVPCTLEKADETSFSVSGDCLQPPSGLTLVVRGEGFLAGLKLDGQPDDLGWPWGGPLSATYDPGIGSLWHPKPFQTDFSVKSLAPTAEGWDPMTVLATMKPVGDAGGIVWFERATP